MSRWEAEYKAHRRELEAAGWELVDADEYMEHRVWRRRNSRYLYPEDIALRLVREGKPSVGNPEGRRGG